ncbi:hypothetical protein L6164_011286 [Bauhinia variegata]|uniref:Uncharacterized protein n=1 Tax=Bauhinia variegata TaxID=167791 RepID=A0ACB9P5D7_BAUVA|nr:hypothetical protein L6164_011286 [Bauhinia variegata]
MPSASTRDNAAPPHLLVIPFPAQGHMIPLLDLTDKIASRGGITITVFTTPNNLSLINPLVSARPCVHILLLPFPPHPSIPPGVENAKDIPHSVRPIMQALAQLHDPLFLWFKSHPSPPQYIISDMFCGWTQSLASQLGIRRLVFSPSGAFALSTMYFLWSERPKRKNDKDENEVLCYHKLPDSPKYPWWQVSPLYRSYVEGDPEAEEFAEGFVGNITSWGLIVNTFAQFEEPYLDYVKKDLGHDRVWAVGPLLPSDDTSGVTQRGGPSSVSVDNIISWLDQREDGKVVYVCFGSQTFLSKHQKEEIASGLDKSGVHFVWAVKEPRKEEDHDHDHGVEVGNNPWRFEERAAGRGLVIRGWVPQVLILGHRAVGAFFTHCGWNSILESVLAGVPMLAWPMSADQFVNATLLVEKLKVARRVCEGPTTVPNSDELARVFTESVSGSGGETTHRAIKLKAAAIDAIREGGSSEKDWRCLINRMSSLV